MPRLPPVAVGGGDWAPVALASGAGLRGASEGFPAGPPVGYYPFPPHMPGRAAAQARLTAMGSPRPKAGTVPIVSYRQASA